MPPHDRPPLDAPASPPAVPLRRDSERGPAGAHVSGERERRGDGALIPRVDRGRSVPLSPAQERLWFLDSLRPGTPLLNLAWAFRAQGQLDIDVLRAAISEIVWRHEVLRTTIRVGAAGPEQIVHPDVPVQIRQADWSGSAVRTSDELRALLAPLLDEPFPASEGPLFRVGVARCGPSEHVLWFAFSQLVWDARSFDVFLGELRVLYEAFAARHPSPLAELPIQYRDYVVWHRAWVDEPAQRRQMGYWRQQLSSPIPHLELPFDRPRPREMGYRGATVPFTVPRATVDGLRQLARSDGTTMEAVVVATLHVLLQKYTGQQDIVVATRTEGRWHPETEPLVGLFAGTVLLRADVHPEATFREHLSRVNDVCTAALDHQDTPFEHLVEALRPARDRRRTPFYQVLLSYQHVGRRSTDLGPVHLRPLPVHAGSASTDLTFWIEDDSRDLCGAIEFSLELFDEQTVRRVLSCLSELLAEIVADPDRPIEDLDGRQAHRAQLDAWNATAMPYRSDALVHELFLEQAQRTPEAIAVHFEDQRVTYRQLAERSAALSQRLIVAGVASDQLVGLCMRRSIDLVVAMIAIHRAGGAYVPLDPTYPRERLEYMLRDSRAAVLVCEPGTRELLEAPGVAIVEVDGELDRRGAARAPLTLLRSSQLAYAIYTSGSTGKPKGVLVEHRNVSSFLRAMEERVDLTPGGVWLAGTSISFDISVLEIFGSLVHGLTVVLLGDQKLGDVAHPEHGIAASIERFGVTHFQCTPSQASLLAADPASRAALSRVKHLLVGGEPLSRELAHALVADVGVEVTNMYGPTETTVWSSTHPVTDTALPVPIGRPIGNTRCYVLDERRIRRPIGAAGELFIAGAGVARGYHERPELTEARFLPDPAHPGEHMYRTGDLGRYRSDGALEFLGRNDFQVKIRGHRIELGEIEHALAAHPAVQEAVVIARDDAGGGLRLVGYVVSRGERVGAEDLRAHLRASLPAHMIPAALVSLSALPLTPGGKVDRTALPAPEISASLTRRRPPQDPIERELVRIWEASLGVSGIGVEDDFFDLGGHSLHGVRLLSEVRRAFGVRLSLAALFEAPNVATMADLVRVEQAKVGSGARGPAVEGAWSTLVPIQARGSLPPFFCVAGKGGNPMNLRHVAAHLGHDQPFYGLQHRGVDGKLAPHRSVEEMAAEFVRDLRRIIPEGPYYIGGFSGGATAAFEMAQQLRAAGERVAALVLLEGVNPQIPRWRFTDKLRYHAGRLGREGSSYVKEAVVSGGRRRVEEIRQRLLSRAARLDPYEYRNEAVSEAWTRMERAYVPRPYPGTLHLFRSRERDTLVFDRHNGWRPLVLGEIRVHDVEGGHVTFVEREHAESTALELEKVLSETREQMARARR